jgi:Ca2+-binding EF-hand superfamily protein
MKHSSVCHLASASALSLLISAGVFAGDTPHSGHAVPSSPQAELQMMDKDQDGKISSAEHSKGAKSMFDAMDADKDSVVTAKEMDAIHAAHSKDGKSAASGKLSSAEKIKTVDGNADGKLSAEEHARGAQQMFGKMDADKDGALTLAELEAGHKTMLSAK